MTDADIEDTTMRSCKDEHKYLGRNDRFFTILSGVTLQGNITFDGERIRQILIFDSYTNIVFF